MNPASVHANELGVVPVIMYHRITTKPDSVYDRTPDQLRAELKRLARDGFVPVTATAFATGTMNVPAGKHPVVLTFDDSTVSQLAFGPDGKPLPDTAVGILLAVAAQHPGFQAVATFFVEAHPFGEADGKRALTWLRDHGFEVGDHTLTHPDLRKLSNADVEKQVGGEAQRITAVLPGVTVRTMALPFGSHPEDRDLAQKGSWQGVPYSFVGVFDVGAGPSPSPFNSRFNPVSIPRIRSGTDSDPDAAYLSSHYLDEFEKNPSGWYTSDGDPDRISFPKALSGRLDKKFAARANPY